MGHIFIFYRNVTGSKKGFVFGFIGGDFFFHSDVTGLSRVFSLVSLKDIILLFYNGVIGQNPPSPGLKTDI